MVCVDMYLKQICVFKKHNINKGTKIKIKNKIKRQRKEKREGFFNQFLFQSEKILLFNKCP